MSNRDLLAEAMNEMVQIGVLTTKLAEALREAVEEQGPCTPAHADTRCLHNRNVYRLPCPVAEWRAALDEYDARAR